MIIQWLDVVLKILNLYNYSLYRRIGYCEYCQFQIRFSVWTDHTADIVAIFHTSKEITFSDKYCSLSLSARLRTKSVENSSVLSVLPFFSVQEMLGCCPFYRTAAKFEHLTRARGGGLLIRIEIRYLEF